MASRKSHENGGTELALALGLLVRKLRSAAPLESQELSWAQLAVMSRLAKEGRATTADLARAERMKPQSMRTIVASLQEMCIVGRELHPTDGRQVYIKLTAKGTAIRKRVKDAKQTWLAQAIAQLDKQDQATLFAAGEIIKRLVEL